MTFNKSNFKSSGRNIHRFLIKESYRLFKNEGYKVKIEYRLPNNKVADIYAEKQKERVVVECLVKPSLNYIIKKIKNYKGYKLIIAYPSNFVPTFPIEDFVDKIIRINIPSKLIEEVIQIQISDEVWEYLNKDKKPGETFDNVLKRRFKIKA